jgi:hypothetical protein
MQQTRQFIVTTSNQKLSHCSLEGGDGPEHLSIARIARTRFRASEGWRRRMASHHLGFSCVEERKMPHANIFAEPGNFLGSIFNVIDQD